MIKLIENKFSLNNFFKMEAVFLKDSKALKKRIILIKF
jgi:hypothetical protein